VVGVLELISLLLFMYANILAIADTCCCTASAADRANEVDAVVGDASIGGSEAGVNEGMWLVTGSIAAREAEG
jgi:hypothetical protein